MSLLEVNDLHACHHGKEILRGVDLSIGAGEVHALMGPNGSGKSTLGHVLAGRPGYDVTRGSAKMGGHDLLTCDAHERARLGLFIAFQHPVEIPGVSMAEFLGEAAKGRGVAETAVSGSALVGSAGRLGLDHALSRSVNDGLSGGEKKRNETLQLSLLGAELAVLDEIDSGLDVDGIRTVASEVLRMVEERGMAVLIITHFVRILEYIPAAHTHVLIDGRIVDSGGPELAAELERSGYDAIRERAGLPGTAPESGPAHGDDIFSL